MQEINIFLIIFNLKNKNIFDENLDKYFKKNLKNLKEKIFKKKN